MASSEEEESTAVVAGVLAGIVLAVVAVVYGASAGKAAVKPAAAPVAAQAAEEPEIAPVGEALVKVFFAVDSATLAVVDSEGVVVKTIEVLKLQPKAIVLLSGFHDPSGDAAHNAALAKARAEAVRDALVAAGVEPARVKLRKPETTVGSGSPEEGRRVEVRVQ
ncbi:MAG: OmpA family protein [Azonexus sp.]|nr:OmpA family protein [Azonexus sp.]